MSSPQQQQAGDNDTQPPKQSADPGGTTTAHPVRDMLLASCLAVVLLGYAWSPYHGYSWHAVAGANGLVLVAAGRRPIVALAATATLVVGLGHAVADPSTAAIHRGWGLGLCTWLVALHGMLWLEGEKQ